MLPQTAGVNGSLPSGQENPGNPAPASGTPGTNGPAPAGKLEPSGGKTIWVLQNGKSKSIVVKTGITDGTLTEVSGDHIREGDQVIIDVLSDGDTTSTTTSSSSRPSGGRSGMGIMRRGF
jgi:HlyD family secretion protein